MKDEKSLKFSEKIVYYAIMGILFVLVYLVVKSKI